MANYFLYLALALALLGCSSFSSAAIVEHSFNVQSSTFNRLCRNTQITAVNDSLPGPTLRVREGDSLIIHVINKSPYPVTIHWHGVLQLNNGWADGPEYITQCPMPPGTNYTYRFNVTRQEGTLWWHAHYEWLRQTVYGALIIRPRSGRKAYPFPMPSKEFPIVLGEWYNADIIQLEHESLASGFPIEGPDAFTINGQPGDLYPCSSNDTVKFRVVFGRTYLLRMINAALNTQFFFKIANHNFTVVAVDASYTNPYVTDIVVLSPGQSADVLFNANQMPGRYYMAASAFETGLLAPVVNGTTTAIIEYFGSLPSSRPILPILPPANDTSNGDRFFSNLTALVTAPFWTPVPRDVDEHLFVTVNLNGIPCTANQTCTGPIPGIRLAASMNNVSFEFPSRLSMLEAFYGNVSGIYTTDFPTTPPVVFDYTNLSNANNPALILTSKSTRAMKFKFNTTVEMVFQNTALLTPEIHPMHLHGFDFHVLAQGYGNFNPAVDTQKFNLVNAQIRNTVAVPRGGWAVIRFKANNPGVWFMHCHLDLHIPYGLTNAIVVENGPTPATTVHPPPADLPRC